MMSPTKVGVQVLRHQLRALACSMERRHDYIEGEVIDNEAERVFESSGSKYCDRRCWKDGK